MNTTRIREKFLTATVGAVIAGAAAPALLFLGTGTAQAIQDVSDAFVPPLVQDISEGLEVPLVQDVSERLQLPAVQDVSDRAPSVTVKAFDPQPDPPGIIDPGSRVGIGGPDTGPSVIDPGSRGILDPGSKVGIIDPGLKVGISDPEDKVGIGGPDTRPAP